MDANEGQAVARNKALDMARGEFVTFVDSDDALNAGTYKRAFEALSASEVDVVMFGVRSIWEDERLYSVHLPKDRIYGELGPSDVLDFCENRLFDYIWNKVYRLAFLNRHGLRFNKDGMPCEDTVFVLECIMAGAKWATISHEGIRYIRTHASSLSRYKRSYVKGTRLASDKWKQYKAVTARASAILGGYREVSEQELMRGEWDNIWRLKTPYTLLERLEFARQHPEISMGNAYLFFSKKLIFSVLRRWLYIRLVQCWHIKRVYPEVKVCEREGTQEV